NDLVTGLQTCALPISRWHGWLAAGLVVALVAAIGAGLLVHGRSSSSTLTGQVAPDFRLPDLRDTSRTVSLASLRGRPVVLNFWEDRKSDGEGGMVGMG